MPDALVDQGPAPFAGPFQVAPAGRSPQRTPMTSENPTTFRPGARAIAAMLAGEFRPYVRHLVGALCLLLASSALLVAGPLLVRRAIDRDIAGGDLPGLLGTVGLYLLVQLAYVATAYAMRNWVEWIGQAMMAGLKTRLLDHVLRLPMSFFDRRSPGELMSRVENDTQALRLLFTVSALTLVGDAILFAGMVAVMLSVSWPMTLLAVVVLPPIAFLSYFFQRRTQPLFVKGRALTAEICATIAELLQGHGLLRTYGRRRWALARFVDLNRGKMNVEYRGEKLAIVWFQSLALMQTLALALLVGVGGSWAARGLVTIGTLAMFLAYVRRFFEPVFRLSEQLPELQKALAAGERIAELLGEPAVVDAPTASGWHGLRDEIRFENVWFRYRDEGEWVLRGVSFAIPAGSRVALVGPTGSGKTTIVSLLLRLYDPTRGRITVDGIDIRAVDRRRLLSQLAYVPQDIFLFPGTLEENLAFGAGGADVRAAARVTRADAVIAGLPDGYLTDVRERGANLSMGERQLLSFTRALARRPSVLLLDEPTSAIDPATERAIVAALTRMLDGRTALFVAHRLATVRDCHQLVVMKDGRVAERGSHAELYERRGIYRGLFDLQHPEECHVA